MLVHQTFRNDALLTLGISIPSVLLVSCFVMGVDDTLWVLQTGPIQLLFAYATMVIFILITEKMSILNSSNKPIIFGIYFIILFLIGVISGSSVSMFIYYDFSILAYVVTPLCVLSIFGVIPAFLLGLVCSIFLRNRILKGK